MRPSSFLVILAILIVVSGCGERAVVEPAALADVDPFGATVGSVCEVIDYQPVQVMAYSLVWGLPGTGSAECPPHIREELVQYLRRLSRDSFVGMYANMSAEQIIASETTAVVQATGFVPPGAPEGERFDVEVTVLPATQTTSLQGGYLMATPMRMVGYGPMGRPVASRTYAMAEGPVFVNPFSRPDGRAADPRRGVILGGGRSSMQRAIRLAIIEPSTRTARIVESSINTRFPKHFSERVADATRSEVSLRIPAAYQRDYHHFVRLVMSLYLHTQGSELEMILARLEQQIAAGEADYEATALAWEAIGRNGLPYVRRHYADASSEWAFYAASAALRLDDRRAIDTLITIARNREHPARLPAARELGRVPNDPAARRALVSFLDTDNDRLRMLAYRALRRSGDPSIRTIETAGRFDLDIVGGTGRPFVAIWATLDARVVLFGGAIECPENIFYTTPDGRVMINAAQDAEQFSITRQTSGNRGMLRSRCAGNVAALVETLARPVSQRDEAGEPGLGLTFSEIAGILYGMQQAEAIPAAFHLHRVPEDLL